MKKLFLTLTLVVTAILASAKVNRIPVYAWTGLEQNANEKSLATDFKAWKKHGVTGVCVNAGMDIDKIRLASKVAKKVGLEYHAWVPTMVQEENPRAGTR